MPPSPSFAERFRQALALRDKNFVDVATAIGRQPKTVGNWASDEVHRSTEPTASDIAAICDFLDVSADYLIGRRKEVCGLVPGSWVVDEDLLRKARQRADATIDYAVQIPAEVSVISDERAQALRREIADMADGKTRDSGEATT